MAKYNFRQGMARRQQDGNGNPTFLIVSGNHVDLVVNPDPTIMLFAHRDENYMMSETQSVGDAWGPFTQPVTSWLYWDIDFQTGVLSRGFTQLRPVTNATAPSNPTTDQHWFDSASTTMKRWNGGAWKEVIRVFAAELQNGATLKHYALGSQVAIGGLGQEHFAGTILHEPGGKPLQVWERDRNGVFLTTETPLSAQLIPGANFRVEAGIHSAKAVESIPIHYCVALNDDAAGEIKLASSANTDEPAVGIAAEDMTSDEVRSYITQGFVVNEQWSWSDDPGTKLYVGTTGVLTTTIPIMTSIQVMGHVVSPTEVYINPQPLQVFNRGSYQSGNYVPRYIDKVTGEEVIWDRLSIPGVIAATGFIHVQATPQTTWTIDHNAATWNPAVQVRDLNNVVIEPDAIRTVSPNSIEVDFYQAQTGTAIVTLLV